MGFIITIIYVVAMVICNKAGVISLDTCMIFTGFWMLCLEMDYILNVLKKVGIEAAKKNKR